MMTMAGSTPQAAPAAGVPAGDVADLRCTCGLVPVKYRVKKGLNIGRVFLRCPARDQCAFFQWDGAAHPEVPVTPAQWTTWEPHVERVDPAAVPTPAPTQEAPPPPTPPPPAPAPPPSAAHAAPSSPETAVGAVPVAAGGLEPPMSQAELNQLRQLHLQKVKELHGDLGMLDPPIEGHTSRSGITRKGSKLRTTWECVQCGQTVLEVRRKEPLAGVPIYLKTRACPATATPPCAKDFSRTRSTTAPTPPYPWATPSPPIQQSSRTKTAPVEFVAPGWEGVAVKAQAREAVRLMNHQSSPPAPTASAAAAATAAAAVPSPKGTASALHPGAPTGSAASSASASSQPAGAGPAHGVRRRADAANGADGMEAQASDDALAQIQQQALLLQRTLAEQGLTEQARQSCRNM